MDSTITSASSLPNACARTLATRGGKSRAAVRAAALLAVSLLATAPLLAQSSQSTVSSVPAGMRVLIRLEDKLSTAKHKVGKKFKAKTLEPIQTADGSLIPMGAEIRGRIGRLEPAGLTGRARLWLDFDDVKTRHGRMPLIASVVAVPGNHSVNPESKEGEIESRTSKGKREIQAAAIGAAVGAATGATAAGGKGAAIGAAVGGAAGFLIASGMGNEIVLEEGTKIEIELERPLYLARK